MHSSRVRNIAEHNGQSSRGTVFPAVAMEEDAPTLLPCESHVSRQFLDSHIEIVVLNWEILDIGLPTLSVHCVILRIGLLVCVRPRVMPRSLDDEPHIVILNDIGVATDLPAAEKNPINAFGDLRRVIPDFDPVYAIGRFARTTVFKSKSSMRHAA